MIGIKIMALSIVGVMLCLILKDQKAYLGMALSCVCVICIFFMGLPFLEKVVSYVRVLYSSFGAAEIYMSTLLKVTAIAILSGITGTLCSDAGMSAVSNVVSLCAKCICLCMTLPVINDFFNELLNVLP